VVPGELHTSVFMAEDQVKEETSAKGSFLAWILLNRKERGELRKAFSIPTICTAVYPSGNKPRGLGPITMVPASAETGLHEK
jgi:hypothetical protein